MKKTYQPKGDGKIPNEVPKLESAIENMPNNFNIIKDLKVKYGMIDYSKKEEESFNPALYLFIKWAYKVPKNWYGFSLQGVPFKWARIIDDFLEWLNGVCPDFEINQIKLKFSGLRFYVELNCSDKELIGKVEEQINLLEDWLQDKSLIY
jgi:hypothetical protein